MTTNKSKISEKLATWLLERHEAAISDGELPSLPLPVWCRMPNAARKWLKQRVLKPSEVKAWSKVHDHPDLCCFWNSSPNPYAISSSAILYLWALMQRVGPKNILEFGGGTSTRLCARYAKFMAKSEHDAEVKIVSIDHDEEWLGDTRRQLEQDGTSQFVRLVYAPLSEQELLGRRMTAYTLPDGLLTRHAETRGFDVCMIDGPWGRIGRSGALAIAAPHLATNCVVLLDDAYRDGEQATIREWIRAFPESLTERKLLLADSHGLFSAQWKP